MFLAGLAVIDDHFSEPVFPNECRFFLSRFDAGVESEKNFAAGKSGRPLRAAKFELHDVSLVKVQPENIPQ